MPLPANHNCFDCFFFHLRLQPQAGRNLLIDRTKVVQSSDALKNKDNLLYS